MTELTNAERRTEQLPYHYDDPNIMDGQLECQEKLYEFNRTHPTDAEGKQRLLKAMFAEIGEGCHVETPAHANWGFAHVHMGKGIYCNVNFTCVDDADITIGDYCMFGPNVVIATAGHPVRAATSRALSSAFSWKVTPVSTGSGRFRLPAETSSIRPASEPRPSARMRRISTSLPSL